MNRRLFVKNSLLGSAGLALALDSQAEESPKPAASLPAAQDALPKGRIGKLEVSRLILGGNLLTHYTHSRDLKYVYRLAAQYKTDEKIMDTGPKPEQVKEPYNEFPGYWCADPQETADVMKAVNKPWIAFKTMAAGAIPPKNAFRYAFKNGADFVLAGMFDFEIAEDAQHAREGIASYPGRDRPWTA